MNSTSKPYTCYLSPLLDPDSSTVSRYILYLYSFRRVNPWKLIASQIYKGWTRHTHQSSKLFTRTSFWHRDLRIQSSAILQRALRNNTISAPQRPKRLTLATVLPSLRVLLRHQVLSFQLLPGKWELLFGHARTSYRSPTLQTSPEGDQLRLAFLLGSIRRVDANSKASKYLWRLLSVPHWLRVRCLHR